MTRIRKYPKSEGGGREGEESHVATQVERVKRKQKEGE